MNLSLDPGTKQALAQHLGELRALEEQQKKNLRLMAQMDEAQRMDEQRGRARAASGVYTDPLSGQKVIPFELRGAGVERGGVKTIDFDLYKQTDANIKASRRKEFNEHVASLRAEMKARYAGMHERNLSARQQGRELFGLYELASGNVGLHTVRDAAEIGEEVASGAGKKGLAQNLGKAAKFLGLMFAGAAGGMAIKEGFNKILEDSISEKLEDAGRKSVALEKKLFTDEFKQSEHQREMSRHRLDQILAEEIKYNADNFKPLRSDAGIILKSAAMLAAEADVSTRKHFLEMTERVQKAGYLGAQALERALPFGVQSNSGPQKARFIDRPDLMADRIADMVRAGGTAEQVMIALREVTARLTALELDAKEQAEELARWRPEMTGGVRNQVLETQRTVYLRGVEEDRMARMCQWNHN